MDKNVIRACEKQITKSLSIFAGHKIFDKEINIENEPIKKVSNQNTSKKPTRTIKKKEEPVKEEKLSKENINFMRQFFESLEKDLKVKFTNEDKFEMIEMICQIKKWSDMNNNVVEKIKKEVSNKEGYNKVKEDWSNLNPS